MFKITQFSRQESILGRLIFLYRNRLLYSGLVFFFLLMPKFSSAQNGLIGSGFGTNDWSTTDCFLGSAGGSRIATFSSNGTGDRYFRLVTCWDDNWSQWGPNSTSSDYQVSIGVKVPNAEIIENSVTKAYYIAGGNTSYRYVVKTGGGGNPPASPRAFVVFEIQGSNVRSVSSVSRTPSSTVYPGQTTTVTATLDGSFHSGQAVFLRYSNSSVFTTSTVVKMTGSGTSYSATIPASTNTAGASVFYYVFTSGDVASIDPSDADLFTINLNNNGGSNYSYTVASSWTTAADGNWNSGSTWQAGVEPVSGQPIAINHNVSLNTDYTVASVSVASGKTLTVNTGQTLATDGGATGAGALAVEGTFQINSGGFASVSINYSSGSTLAYNTAGTYSANQEWVTNSTTSSGVPWNVHIINSSVDFGVNNPTQYRHVKGNLTIGASGALVLSGSVGGDLSVAGDLTLDGTLTHNNRLIEFVGTTNSSIGGTLDVNFLKINKTSGATVTINSDLTVNSTLWLDAGQIVTGSNTVIAAGLVSQTSGWVHGKMRKNVSTGSSIARTFEVGDASTYNPVTITFTLVNTAGSLTVSTEDAVLSSFSSSPLNKTLYVKRNWKFTQSGLDFTNYTALLNFQTADLTSGASHSRLIGGLYTSAWSLPSVGVRTTTSTQLTGLVSIGDLMLADALPEVGSPNASTSGSYSALLEGEVESGTSLTEVGIVWSAVNTTPTTADNKVTASGVNSTGSFEVAVSELPASSTVYFRVYATNPFGTSYSSAKDFTTNATIGYTLINGQAASIVLGQTNFTTNTSGLSDSKFNVTRGVAIDWVNSKVYLADASNNRVLRYAYPLTMLSLPEVAFGQPDFTTNASGVSINTFDRPVDVAVDNTGNLWVADALNHRVLRFDRAYSISSNQPDADGVLGQTTFSDNLSGCSDTQFSGIRGIDLDRLGNLYVADYGNNRVLRFDRAALRANGAKADGVFGQSDFVSNASGLSEKEFNSPSSVATFGTTLWVTDQKNNRTLRFDDAHLVTSQPEATVVLGQSDFTTSSSSNSADKQKSPYESFVDAKGTLWVVDEGNHRLIGYYDVDSKTNGSSADVVLGQQGFDANVAAVSKTNLKQPRAVGVHPEELRILLTDAGNHRLLDFEGKVNAVSHGSVSASSVGAYSAVLNGNLTGILISEAGFVWSTINSTPTLSDNRVVASGVLDAGSLAVFVHNLPAQTDIYFRSYAINPQGVSYSTAQMFTTQSAPDFDVQNGQAATFLIGQSNFTSRTAQTTQSGLFNPADIAIDSKNGKLYVADFANHRVLRFAYPLADTLGASAELVFGQSDFISNLSGNAANRFKNPAGLAVDNQGRLWVSDASNNRVLWFDNAHAISSNEPNANGVLGFSTFSVRSSDMRAKLFRPARLAIDELGNLWVADSRHNRVLRFNHAATKSNGANADLVLGQSDFTTITAATTQSGLNEPTGLALYGNTLYVADTKNNRVLRFDNISSKTNGSNADVVFGQSNFTSSAAALTQGGLSQPSDCAVDAEGTLWVADNTNRRILAFNDAGTASSGVNADIVLGQAGFTTSVVTVNSQRTTSNFGLAIDAERLHLFSADRTRNRVLGYAMEGSSGSRMEAPLQSEPIRDLIVYPNPSNGLFKLRFDLEESEQFELSVFDAAGKLIFKTIDKLDNDLNLTSFEKGFYILKFTTSQGYESIQKLIVE